MARLSGVPEATYAALDQIRTVTMITFGSLFTPDQTIWSLANLERLHTLFVDGFDEGDGDFFGKFRTQLDGATAAEMQLAAELLYVQQFFTAQTGAEKKIQNVREVLGWSNQPVDVPGWAIEGVQIGLAGDQSFNQHRPYHLAWLIEFLLAWHRTSRDRGELLRDPWQFREFVQEVEGSRGAHQPMREAWMYMMFPASFEAISSRSDKSDVREAFLDLLGHPPSDNIDADLLDIRRALTRDAGDGFHLYQGEVAQRWRPTSADSGPLPEVSRERLVDAIRHFDSEQRQRPEWAAWESNGTYKFALELEGNLYPPKEIVSLATGRLKSSFGGGEQTNKYLTEHGFSVQRLRRSTDGTEEADDEKEEFTLAEAAEHILAIRREPTSIEALWNEIEKQRLFKSSHSDSYRSLYSVLYRASVHNRRAGSPRHRPFVRVAPSVFGLTALGHVADPTAQEERAPTARAATKREIVELLKRDELQQIADYYELELDDRRVNWQLVDAIVRSKKARIAEILTWFSRDRLKDICIGLELDSTGREKALLVDRILGESSAPVEVDERPSGPTGESAPAALSRLLPDALNLTAPGDGWPSLGSLTVGDDRYEVSAYVRLIGGSSRGNALERRFQNPSQQSPIVDDPERYELLLGIWTERGDERAVIVAFDPYRRMERNTRFSLFMPLALLEQAADTGFATHENNKGETLYAFRPENIGRYVQTQIEDGTWKVKREREASEAPKAYDPPRTPKSEPKRRSSPKVSAPSSRPAPQTSESSIYIRPQVGMFSAFARLNYKPWFALAEFVDNSIQSFLHNRHKLEGDGHEGPLVIDINIDDNELSVTDRAGGIAWPDFPRAFSPASPPEDASGLSEFGLGMKAAACWFSKRWHVRTSALGEPVERTVTFDIPRIAREGIEDLPIETRPSRDSDHFTVITMHDLRVHPRSRTLTKIREHLSSIYRVLTKDGVVRLRLTAGGRTEELVYEHPELLVAPHHRSPLGPAVLWRQEFVADLGDRKVTGWAGIMKSGSHSRAGFSVFRRRRLIEGSVGETYKPALIFGSPNSFASQRVVGEMFVEGFDVTHTKDGIQWHGYEDEVLESIRRQLDSYRMPLLDQAEGYRARKVAATLPKDFGAEAVTATVEALSTPAAANALHAEAIAEPTGIEPEVQFTSQTPPPVLQQRVIKIPIEREGRSWDVHLKLVHDRALPFYRTSSMNEDGREVVTVELNLDHEFSIGHINDNESVLQPVLRLVASLALAEKVARDAGVKNAGIIRQYTNDILEAIAAFRPPH